MTRRIWKVDWGWAGWALQGILVWPGITLAGAVLLVLAGVTWATYLMAVPLVQALISVQVVRKKERPRVLSCGRCKVEDVVPVVGLLRPTPVPLSGWTVARGTIAGVPVAIPFCGCDREGHF